MNKRLIYTVEDDEGIQELYRGAFEGIYEVESFYDGDSFYDGFLKRKPDLVILDVMLPGDDGFKVLTEIRKIDELLPVIIVSAKTDEISFVKGLNKGADDYMAKPFSVLELLARVKTNLRRTASPITSAGDIVVDTNTYTATVCGQTVELTRKEFLLLKLFVENRGVTLSRDKLFSEIWGEDYIGETRTLDMHVASLREKIKEAVEERIVTVRGVGYRFESK